MTSPRRYYLLKRLAARRDCLEEGVWIALQTSYEGTSLPDDFPYRAELVAGGYSTVEDLDDAGPDELAEFAKLDSSTAKAVCAALAAL